MKNLRRLKNLLVIALTLFAFSLCTSSALTTNAPAGWTPGFSLTTNAPGGFGMTNHLTTNNPSGWTISSNLNPKAPGGWTNHIALTTNAPGWIVSTNGGGGGNTSANLVAYWSFDETTGTRYDGSTNHNDLVPAISDVLSTTGITNNSALFDSTDPNWPNNDLVLANPIVGFDPNQDFTVSFWVKLNSDFTADAGFLSIRDASDQNVCFAQENDGGALIGIGNMSAHFIPDGQAASYYGTWLQVTVSTAAGAVTCWTNTATSPRDIAFTAVNSDTFSLPLSDFEIGGLRNYAGAYELGGAIDEFYIWQNATP